MLGFAVAARLPAARAAGWEPSRPVRLIVPADAGGEADAVARAIQAIVSLNRPAEAVADDWASGQLRPLCVFRRGARPGAAEEGSALNTETWSGVPNCRGDGLRVKHSPLRGVLLPAAVGREQRSYEALLRRVAETPAWREVLETGGLEAAALGGEAFSFWLAAEELRHEAWMYAGEVFARR